jgi:hypothetical protein
MRTNVTLEDDIYEQAVNYAAAKNLTLGKALGELVRRGNSAPPPPSRLVQGANGLLVMPSRRGGKKITQDMVNKAREEGYFG